MRQVGAGRMKQVRGRGLRLGSGVGRVMENGRAGRGRAGRRKDAWSSDLGGQEGG